MNRQFQSTLFAYAGPRSRGSARHGSAHGSAARAVGPLFTGVVMPVMRVNYYPDFEICRWQLAVMALSLCLSACSLSLTSPESLQAQRWLHEHLPACIVIAALVLMFIGLLLREAKRTPPANDELIYEAWRLETLRHPGIRFSAVVHTFDRLAFNRRAVQVYVQFVGKYSREPTAEELWSLVSGGGAPREGLPNH
ncbi:MAG TPA: hypothetical protein VEU32_02375 [Burkholderiales bacterium]|nr:hypothetical protein [Burkholderiales bacterium]